MPAIHLGVNNAFAFKHWPEPEAWARIVAQDLNLRHVQFSFDLLDPLLPEPGRSDLCRQISEAAQLHELSIDSAFTGLIVYAQNLLAHPAPAVRQHARRWYGAALEMSAQLGARSCGGHMGAMSLRDFGDPARRSAMRRELVDAIRQLAAQASRIAGLEYLLWELMPLPWEPPDSPEEAVALLEEVNDGAALPVRLCFDLGHCRPNAAGGPVDPHTWLQQLLPWTPLVHLQQTDGLGDRHWPFTPDYERQGIVDPKRVVEIVRNSPLARVDLVLEVGHAFDADPRQIITDHQRSVDAFARWL